MWYKVFLKSSRSRCSHETIQFRNSCKIWSGSNHQYMVKMNWYLNVTRSTFWGDTAVYLYTFINWLAYCVMRKHLVLPLCAQLCFAVVFAQQTTDLQRIVILLFYNSESIPSIFLCIFCAFLVCHCCVTVALFCASCVNARTGGAEIPAPILALIYLFFNKWTA